MAMTGVLRPGHAQIRVLDLEEGINHYGKVLGLIETPGNDVLRIGDGESPERLLPFVAAVVLDVDLAARHVRVDWEADW